MSKVTISCIKDETKEVQLHQIPVGTVFVGRISGHSPRLFLKASDGSTYGCIVALEHNDFLRFDVWDAQDCPVMDYREVDIDIKVKEKK